MRPPGRPDPYDGRAPGCGDGIPEPGTYCFRRLCVSFEYTRHKLATDLDLDGHDDLVLGERDGVVVLYGDGTGGFSDPVEVDLFVTDEGRLLTAEINGDGRPDLAFAVIDFPAGIHVVLADGDRSFSDRIAQEIPGYPGHLIDLDLDGLADLVTGSDGWPATVSSLKGLGDGTFGPPAVNPSPVGWCYLTAFADAEINGDAITDLFVIGSCNGHYDLTPLAVVHGNGMLLFEEHASYPTGDDPSRILVGNFDDDGVVGVATANAYTMDVSVLPGVGDGTFAEQRRVLFGGEESVCPECRDLADAVTGDLDGDGLDDLAATLEVGYDIWDPVDQPLMYVALSGADSDERMLVAVDVLGQYHRPWTGIGDFNGDGLGDPVYSRRIDDEHIVVVLLSDP